MPRVFRYKGQPAHERSYVGIIAQELPEELVPFCRFRTSMTPAALYARMQGDTTGGSLEGGGGAGGEGGGKAYKPEVVVDLNVKEDFAKGGGAKAEAQKAEAGAAVEDGVDWGEVECGEAEEEEEEGLFLVDLSALQFVLVNAYKVRALTPALAPAPTPTPTPAPTLILTLTLALSLTPTPPLTPYASKELEGRVRSQQLEVAQLRRRADQRQADEASHQATAIAVALDHPGHVLPPSPLAAYHPLLLRFKQPAARAAYCRARAAQQRAAGSMGLGITSAYGVGLCGFGASVLFALDNRSRFACWNFLGRAEYWGDGVCVAQLLNLLVLLAAAGATYHRGAAVARARGGLLLLLLACAHVTVALQLAASLRDGAPLEARAQDGLRLWYGVGLSLPVLAAHAEPHWPALFLLQLGLCASAMAMLALAYCGHHYDGTAPTAPFADTLSLCAKLALPHVLTMGGVYLLLRAKLVAFGRDLGAREHLGYHNLPHLEMGSARRSDGSNALDHASSRHSVVSSEGKACELSAHARRVATACTQGLKYLPRAWLPRAAKEDAAAAPPPSSVANSV